MYDLILSDFDGTLARSDKSIDDYTKNVIRSYAKAGGIFTIATGRSTEGIRSQWAKLGLDGFDFPIVSYQGAHIETAHSRQVLRDLTLDRALASEIVRDCLELGVFVQSYDGGDVVVQAYHPCLDGYCGLNGVSYRKVTDLVGFVSRRNTRKLLLRLPPERFDDVQKTLSDRYRSRCRVCRSSRHFLEFFPSEAGKGAALYALCEFYGIPAGKTLALGDQYNDLDMIRNAGLGVAVSNAVPALLEAADEIAPSNNDDGVAKTIVKYHPFITEERV